MAQWLVGGFSCDDRVESPFNLQSAHSVPEISVISVNRTSSNNLLLDDSGINPQLLGLRQSMLSGVEANSGIITPTVLAYVSPDEPESGMKSQISTDAIDFIDKFSKRNDYLAPAPSSIMRVTWYRIGSLGIDLYHYGHNAELMEAADSIGTILQAIGRHHQLK